MEEGDEDEQFKAVMDEAKQAMQVLLLTITVFVQSSNWHVQ